MEQRTRKQAADKCLQALDTEFFRAFCDESRLEVVRAMIRLGPAKVGEIADSAPVERSVVSRHLKMLERTGIAVRRQQGRCVIYELDGPAIMAKLAATVSAIQPLVPLCCPGDLQHTK